MREAVVDANILLRFLTDEPRELADRVAAIFEAAERLRVALVVTALTVTEVVYVLESVYRWDRQAIAERLIALVSASVLQFAEQATLAQALAWYRDINSLHFADAYVAAVAAARATARSSPSTAPCGVYRPSLWCKIRARSSGIERRSCERDRNS
ncbi:MAG TPA: PIN domain-containing protein [Thermomicrobiaceae bacterium]|nr:PIN domain-containing protein [Thermomicrobiaceae bacterium]